MLKKIVLHISLFFAFFPLVVNAQELNCTVDVVSPQIQDAAAQLVFKNLKDAIYQFMNNTKFTSDNFTNQEKIDCTLFFNMTTVNAPGDYAATLQIQARRPIYKSSYSSTMFNYQDNNIHILYQLNQPIVFNINTYSDNLTALLSYYAYIIIGNDYDSYSLDGGTPFFLKAQTIVSNAQNSGEKGWNPLDGDQTRYSLITNILDETYFEPLRKAMYYYHRLGLDVMYVTPEKGRAQITNALNFVQEVYNDKPANFNILLFFNAKANELANIYSEASNDEKSNVYKILSAIDPTDIDKFSKLKVE
ncbi:MAG TPA: DUF4835 family protein [Bacteroidia bacterium]|nr:DUF4835 family protein [Bacteroidia bacterium]